MQFIPRLKEAGEFLHNKVKRVYVKKAFRKRGIAYCLIRELEKLVMKDDLSFSIIVTGAHNVPAIRLYEKLGYHLTDDFGQFIGDDSVICMRKEFRK